MTTARRATAARGHPGGGQDRSGGPVRAVLAGARRTLWPIPVLGVLLALAVGLLLPEVDERLARGGAGETLGFVFGGGPSAARDLLAAIAGSLISVTGVTFSLTVVALQLGSSQYSPRLLQTFVTDRFVQLTLAQLVATFVYALTVLRTVRTESATESENAFVPRLSITVAYALTLGSVLALVLFLGHLARILRVETMLRDVHDEAGRTLDRELGGSDDHGSGGPVALPPGPGAPVEAASSGFLVDVDEAGLVDVATELDATVLLAVRIGDSVVEGTPVAHAWPSRPGGHVDTALLHDRLRRSLRLGYERSPDRDVGYSLRKVMDVAARALSPGINDATTAVHALSHASALLGDLLSRPLHPTPWFDDGVLRLVAPQWRPDELLDLVLEDLLHHGAGQPAVLRRTAALLREVGWRTRGHGLDDHLRARLRQLAEVAEESTRIPADERELWRERLEDALAGRWPAEVPAGTDQAFPAAAGGGEVP